MRSRRSVLSSRKPLAARTRRAMSGASRRCARYMRVRVLHRRLRRILVQQHAAGDAEHPPAVAPDQRLDRTFLPGACALDEQQVGQLVRRGGGAAAPRARAARLEDAHRSHGFQHGRRPQLCILWLIMKKRPARVAGYCAGALALCALQPAPGADLGTAGAARVHPQRWPKLRPVPPRDESLERRLDLLLARMRPEQKVGQLIQADIDSITPDDLRHYPLGSILNGGNSSPHGDKLAPPGEWLTLADRFYDRIGEITALEVRVTGLDWAFSPSAAVARDARWGRT